MKETAISLSIIAVIIFSCIYSTHATNDICSKLSTSLSACSNDISTNNWNKAYKTINEAQSYYQHKLPLMKTFIMHDELNEIQTSLTKINSAIQMKDTNIGITEIDILIEYLKTFSNSETLTIPNIL